MTKAIHYFLIFSHGHSAGGWLGYICNNHPSDKITVLGEVPKPSSLAFERRGIPLADMDKETLKTFKDRIYYGDTCLGIIKSFRAGVLAHVQKHNGLVCCAVRNPIHIVGKRYKRKMGPAKEVFQKVYHRPMVTDDEIFEGHVIYYAEGKYRVFLDRADQYPIYRVEDLNSSCGSDGVYFKGFMECLTKIECPWEYVRHIQENILPCQLYNNIVEWDSQGRVCRVAMELRNVLRDGGEYCHWGPDPSVPKYWNSWTDNQKELYQKWFGELDRRLGYNQQHAGSVESDWEWSGKYEWGNP